MSALKRYDVFCHNCASNDVTEVTREYGEWVDIEDAEQAILEERKRVISICAEYFIDGSGLYQRSYDEIIETLEKACEVKNA